MTLIINKIVNGQEKVLAEIEAGPILIGRSPDRCQIVIDNPVVSTIHGEILFFGGQWFFKDLGSSNGSSINEIRLKSDQPYFLRDGDKLTMANENLTIRCNTLPPFRRSVYVFKEWEPVALKEAPEHGHILSVGGFGSEFSLSEAEQSDTIISLEANEQSINLVAKDSNFPVFLNQRSFKDSYLLKDRDLIEVADYSILVDCSNDHISSGIGEFASLKTWGHGNSDSLSFKNKNIKHSKFGSEGGTAAEDTHHDSPSVKSQFGKSDDFIFDKNIVLILLIVAVVLCVGAIAFFLL